MSELSRDALAKSSQRGQSRITESYLLAIPASELNSPLVVETGEQLSPSPPEFIMNNSAIAESSARAAESRRADPTAASSEKTPANPTSKEPQQRNKPHSTSSIFQIPKPLRILFDSTPLRTYESSGLPVRSKVLHERIARDAQSQGSLWVWIHEGSGESSMSFNPACLRWQAYLHFLSVSYTSVSSSNHSSPSGALPFLIPSIPNTSPKDSRESQAPIPTSKLRTWAEKTSPLGKAALEPSSARADAYASLIDRSIRRAWLYTLHHTPLFHTLTLPLYIPPSRTPFLAHTLMARDLLAAATAELQKHTAVIDAEEIYTAADESFGALETVLGDREWFGSVEEAEKDAQEDQADEGRQKRPGWLDAVVFGYTGLILRDEGGERGDWRGLREGRLGVMLRKRKGLLRHRERIVESYFREREPFTQ